MKLQVHLCLMLKSGRIFYACQGHTLPSSLSQAIIYSVHVVLEIEFSWQYNRYLLIVNEIKKAAHELSEYLFDNCIIWVVNPTLVFIC